MVHGLVDSIVMYAASVPEREFPHAFASEIVHDVMGHRLEFEFNSESHEMKLLVGFTVSDATPDE
jgi:hypothetical protein